MAQLLLDLVTSFGNCLSCFPGSPTLKINNRSFKILRLLGEGGFSYVYLVEDTSTQAQYALKKIRCPFGAESVAQAMREVDAYRLFGRTPGIIHAVDHAVASERGGGGDDPGAKTVYVLLPYYKRGNLQDLINANAPGGGGPPSSYALRDIKPGKIMITDSGNAPILMDLGSLAASPLPITSPSLALQTQDTAAEHSTMPYRAPELFDVQTGAVIDTKVDIWSMGCTLYACLVGKSPFEARSDETGGSLSLWSFNGDWRFPDEGVRGTATGAMRAQVAAPAAAAAAGGYGLMNAHSDRAA
ncbi:serine/threonine-protein kinase [Verticillium alfalfae VaMs.102]|uniref:non-specific serine/threonine protein kinase n=1 Tax=Verticillium alfalfae (strain VaMs.102 / ATCC MYA-4576 / FGSC 10136) TaxID=526221 RepID=C9SI76_VERA1|nr:serine/threonine-protein kinase [Verticillium alfalfae VaMs.102]EEY18649.1 serine/threonine-protein kinase [Verticillium alfalfae VaMs.102]